MSPVQHLFNELQSKQEQVCISWAVMLLGCLSIRLPKVFLLLASDVCATKQRLLDPLQA